jgi:hypothetical protein
MSGDRLRSSLAELVAIIQHHCSARIYDLPYVAAAMTRARALLAEAQPEPVEPTDEQLDKTLFDQHAELPGDGQPVPCLEWEQFEAAARAVLARWGRPAPVPQEQADG